MKSGLYVVRLGNSERLERLLRHALEGGEVTFLPAEALVKGLHDARILFAVAIDALGVDESFLRTLRVLRGCGDCLQGSIAAMIVDGADELYTKSAAQELALSANMAGCTFPGKPLVEGTGSLYNQHILARRMELSWEETYFARARDLVARLMDHEPLRFANPRVLMLHASDNLRSNTVWLGRELLQRLPENFTSREISLQNGTIHDCRGCSYAACLHYAQSDTCFYGGVVAEEVLPAIEEADLLLFLCPNYNDALSANLVALINRMTALVVQKDLSDKYVAAVVVSGYSGSDIVARQLLGAMSLNRGCILPPGFGLLHTAHDPGDALGAFGVDALIERFSENLKRELIYEYS